MKVSVFAAAATDPYLTQSGTNASVDLMGAETSWYHWTLRTLQGITSSEKEDPGAYNIYNMQTDAGWLEKLLKI